MLPDKIRVENKSKSVSIACAQILQQYNTAYTSIYYSV